MGQPHKFRARHPKAYVGEAKTVHYAQFLIGQDTKWSTMVGLEVMPKKSLAPLSICF